LQIDGLTIGDSGRRLLIRPPTADSGRRLLIQAAAFVNQQSVDRHSSISNSPICNLHSAICNQ
jgi:hypothetical protein